jgi:two-component system, OmpR family, phosphate regulon response regulator OmpR
VTAGAAAPAGGGDDQPQAHVLVVDDDARLRDLLQRYLVNNGYLVTVAADAEEAKDRLRNLAFDLAVLDVMLPGQSGVELTEELRRDGELPILLLTARGEPEDRIGGLEAGADDYLVKPFEPRELLLRIGTILRRVQQTRADDIVRFGPFAFNRASGELRRNESEAVHLTTGEIALLQVLAARPGRAVSRAELGERGGVAGSDRAVDVQMARLRRKIEEDPRQPRWLLTARGSGYVLRTGS